VTHDPYWLRSYRRGREERFTRTTPAVALKLTWRRAQRGLCYLCGEPLDGPGTWDHVTPRRLGGPDHPVNVLLAHRRCNEAKAHRAPYPCELLYLRATYAIVRSYR
jgi:5-methylcytosine-specific restriction endonuclease McrA